MTKSGDFLPCLCLISVFSCHHWGRLNGTMRSAAETWQNIWVILSSLVCMPGHFFPPSLSWKVPDAVHTCTGTQNLASVKFSQQVTFHPHDLTWHTPSGSCLYLYRCFQEHWLWFYESQHCLGAFFQIHLRCKVINIQAEVIKRCSGLQDKTIRHISGYIKEIIKC